MDTCYHDEMAPGADGCDDTDVMVYEQSPEFGCARGVFYGLAIVVPFWVAVIAAWLA